MATKVTKKDLIREIANDQGRTQEDVGAVIAAFLEKTVQAAENGHEVSLTGFGGFIRRERKAREGRNPQTGETVQISASSTLAFRPHKAVKDRLNS